MAIDLDNQAQKLETELFELNQRLERTHHLQAKVQDQAKRGQ
jgi:predicted  nucleic acid-binding Zn-ribbon protein